MLGRVHAQQLVARHVQDLRRQIVDHDEATLRGEGAEIPGHRHHVLVAADGPVAAAVGMLVPVDRRAAAQPGELFVGDAPGVVVRVVDVDLHAYSTSTPGRGSPCSSHMA